MSARWFGWMSVILMVFAGADAIFGVYAYAQGVPYDPGDTQTHALLAIAAWSIMRRLENRL